MIYTISPSNGTATYTKGGNMATLKVGDKVNILAGAVQVIQSLNQYNLPTTGEVKYIYDTYISVQVAPMTFIDVKPEYLELVQVQDFNTQAEVWEYLLTGGMVVSDITGKVYSLVNGRVHTKGKLSTAAFENHANYKKYTEPKWYENIPSTGILCWLSDSVEIPNSSNNCRLVLGYNHRQEFPFRTTGANWRYAILVTPEEAATLIYNSNK